jgi:hypothetical protein
MLMVCVIAMGPAAWGFSQIHLPVAPYHGYRIMRTEHFRFIYEPQDVESARTLAGFAEQVYGDLTRFLHSSPKEITCLLIGRTDAANGYFTPLPPHHIGLYLAPPDSPYLGVRSRSWLKQLFVHELTHYIHLVYDDGFFHALSRVFGPTLSPVHGAFLPGWAVEGIAVNTETMFTHGGRGRSPYFELYYRSLMLNGTMFPLPRAGYDSYAFPPGREYIAGYLIIDYIISHFGEDAFYRIHDQFVRNPFAGLDEAVRNVTGASLKQIYALVEEDLSRKYAGALSIPPGILESPEKAGQFYLPRPTRRGLYVYHTRPDRLPEIALMDPKTRKLTPVIHAWLTDPSSFSTTPGGRYIVFSSYGQDATVAGGPEVVADLYLYDADRHKTVRLTWNAHLIQPAISPDGSWIVALQRVGSRRRLVRIRLHPGARHSDEVQARGPIQLLYAAHRVELYNPSFSPDGTHLAFALNRAGRQGVVTVALKDLPPRNLSNRAVTTQDDGDWNALAVRMRIPTDGSEEYYPSYVDSHTIIYTADAGGILRLFERNTKTGLTREVLEDPVGARRGVVFAGGILYETYTADGAAIRYKTLAPQPFPLHNAGTTAPPAPAPFPADSLNRTPVEEPNQQFEAIPPSEVYRQFPVPDVWLPIPSLTTNAKGAYAIGIGALSYGATVTGDLSWLATAGFYPGLMQPFGGLNVDFARGGVRMAYTFSQGYQAAIQRTRQALSMDFSPIAFSALDTSRVLTLAGGASYTIDRTAASDFTVADGLNGAVTAGSERVDVAAAIQYRRQYIYPEAMLYPSGTFQLGIRAQSRLPVLGQTYQGVLAEGNLGLTVRGFSPLQSVGLSLHTAYDTGKVPASSDIAPPGFLVLPQASPGPGTPGVAMIQIRYGATLATTDLPLPFSSGLVAIGASVFAAYRAGFDPGNRAFGPSTSGTPRFVPENRVAIGTDLTLMLSRNTIMLPLRMGVTVLVDPSLQSAPLFPSDFGIFLTVGGVSFQSGYTPGKELLPWSLP